MSGGWYDAGDYGKYTVSGGIAVWQVLNILQLLRRVPGRRALFSEATLIEPLYALTGIYLERNIRVMDGFNVLAEPTRRRILDELRAVWRSDEAQSGSDVATLVDALALPQPTVSKHLRVLREAGVVTAQVEGPRRIYRLSRQPLSDVAAWLEPYRRMWLESLDRLERHLDTVADQPENQEDVS